MVYVQMSTASQSANCSRVDVRITADQPTCHNYSVSNNNDIVTTYLFPPRNYLSRLGGRHRSHYNFAKLLLQLPAYFVTITAVAVW